MKGPSEEMSSSTDIEAQNHDGITQEFSRESELRRIKSAGAVTISPELFEKARTSILG